MRSVALLLLAILFLGALANTYERRRVVRRQGGPPPHKGKNDGPGHGGDKPAHHEGENAAGGHKGGNNQPHEGGNGNGNAGEHEGGNNQPHEGGNGNGNAGGHHGGNNNKPHHGGNNNKPHEEGNGNNGGHGGNNQPHEEGNGNGNAGGHHGGNNNKPHHGGNGNNNGNQGGHHGGGEDGEGAPNLDEILGDFCGNVSEGCTKEGAVSGHDGKVTDLCDEDYCIEWAPKNLCFFECAGQCENVADKEKCANDCMKCGSRPPTIPLESFPPMCKEIHTGCKKENGVSKKDGTMYDLCDEKYCNEFLPRHQCALFCMQNCSIHSTGDKAQDEGCGNECMKCQDPKPEGGDHHTEGGEHEGGVHVDGNEGNGGGEVGGDHHTEGGDHEGGVHVDGNEGSGEGEGEVEGAGEHDGEGDAEHEAGGKGNHEEADASEAKPDDAAEAAARVVRLMKHSRPSTSMTKIIAEARGRTAYRRYAHSAERRRRAPVRRHYYAVRRARYYSPRYDRFW